MNKLLKGAAAGAAGITLLAGGVGTYATWTDSKSVNATGITAGKLTVALASPATWRDANPIVAGNFSWNAGTDLMVPGDRVTLTQPLALEATGKNLKVDVDVTGVNSSTWTALTVTGTLGGKTLTAKTDKSGFTFAPTTLSDVNGAKELVLTFELPLATTGVVDQGRSVALNNVGVAVTQVRP